MVIPIVPVFHPRLISVNLGLCTHPPRNLTHGANHLSRAQQCEASDSTRDQDPPLTGWSMGRAQGWGWTRRRWRLDIWRKQPSWLFSLELQRSWSQKMRLEVDLVDRDLVSFFKNSCSRQHLSFLFFSSVPLLNLPPIVFHIILKHLFVLWIVVVLASCKIDYVMYRLLCRA